jgi:hypothetical protein
MRLLAPVKAGRPDFHQLGLRAIPIHRCPPPGGIQFALVNEQLEAPSGRRARLTKAQPLPFPLRDARRPRGAILLVLGPAAARDRS